MASLLNVTRDDVLSALALYDSEAPEGSWRGFRPSKSFQLVHNGRAYPSKAVLGVAANLAPSQFFGGIAQTVPALLRLGFEIQKDGRRVSSLAKLAERAGLPAPTTPDLPVAPAASFVSGTNRPGEIRGFASVGHDVGVAVPELNPEAIEALRNLAGSDVQVFCDSGAFSEVKFGASGPEVVKPMTDDDWQNVLGTYRALGQALGGQLWIVAPDRVGCQTTTIERLSRYRSELAELDAMGVRILVPIQKGHADQHLFALHVHKALPGIEWTPALPCAKAATTAAEVAAFVKGYAWTNPTQHVHLLGIGPTSRKVGEYLAPFVGSDVSVSLDACWITANVGRTNGRENDPAETKGGPRRYTLARDIAKGLLGAIACAATVAELAVLIAKGGA